MNVINIKYVLRCKYYELTAIREAHIGMIIKLLTPTDLNHEKRMSCSEIQKTNYPYFEHYGYFSYIYLKATFINWLKGQNVIILRTDLY